MLDGTYYFECQCGSDEHTLKFTLDKGGDACDDVAEIYTSVFLNAWEPWYRRAWSSAARAMSCGFWSGVDSNHVAPACAVTVFSCSMAAGR